MPGLIKTNGHVALDPSTSSPEMLPLHDSPEQELPIPKRAKTLSNRASAATDPFRAGSILRIRMQNFMTYDDISYDFGPALNMIIGPNGSGKSTVVAGICLGLGFDPKIMGRAEKVEATIKHGTQSAKIEIELKGNDSEPNVVITRQFGHGVNGGKGQNDWLINGRKTTHKLVQELVRAFNCQIDNLCQFLPQDKVASFARMKPVEMLSETMRTVGDGSMGVLHEELITLQTKHNSELSTRKIDEERLSGLKSRQEVLERDVARFREREANKREIYIREKRLPFARYNQAKAAYSEAKTQYNESKARLLELKRANVPLEEQETTLTEECERLEQQTSRLQERLEAALRKVERCALPLKDAEDTMTSLENKYKQEREAEKNSKVRLRELRERVARESRSLGDEPSVEDEIATLIQQIRDLNGLERQYRNELQDLQLYLNAERDTRKKREEEMEQKDRELTSLDDVRAARYKMLKERNADAAEAIQWLENNQREFEHRVYGPVLMEVQVINKKFARAAQHVIMQNAFTFTCQSRKDYQTFNRLLVDGQSAGRRLRLNVAEYSRTSAPQLRDQRSPLSLDEVKEFGFDGYLLDCLDGPDAVLNTLCHAAQINSLPIGTAKLSQDDIQRIETATKNNRAVFQRYILGATDTKIFRGYGQVSSESQAIHNDGSVFSHVVDGGRKKQLEQEIEEIRESINSEVPTLQAKSAEFNQVKEQLRVIEGEKKGINAQRAELQKRRSTWHASKAKAEQTKEELDRLENAPADYQDNMAAIRADQVANTVKFTEQTIKYKDVLKDAQEVFEKYVISASAHIQSKANKDAFETHNRLVQAELRDAENEVKAGKDAKDKSLKYAHSIHKLATEAVAELSEEDKDMVSNYDPETTVEELELQIEDYRNRLTFFADTDGNVLDNYEARAREIQTLQDSLDEKQESLAEMSAGIENRRRVLESQLEAMREKIDVSFGEAFRSIQCLGEVRISKPVDFAAWALEIWVQFRDTDSLQMLTGERQSGGERSVSTIFYLMALQSLSIAPFRVVDEINQGMDPRNERRVHARMVEIACEITTSQYFLITPKLLTDLDYHSNMKVHCVTSGNLGRAGNKIGYSKYLAALRMRKTQSQATQAVH